MRPIPSILVIDDNPEALEILASLLGLLGTEKVSQAKSAEEALELLQKESFTVIISDYCLEGMDGVQFLEKIRAQGNQTPVLILSGAPDKAGVIRATRHHKVDFFGKPFQVAELCTAVERLAHAA